MNYRTVVFMMLCIGAVSCTQTDREADYTDDRNESADEITVNEPGDNSVNEADDEPAVNEPADEPVVNEPDDEPAVNEPADETTGYVNTVRKDGISFKLSLLNEDGKPATVFREGENFSFCFEMENLRKNDKREYPAHFMGGLFNSGFCRIYTTDGDSVCAVFQETAACVYMFMSYPFDGDNRLIVSHPLHDDNEEWPHGTCVYRRNPTIDLPKGNYYTGFTYTFRYYILNEWEEVGPVTMRVDFTIK
jgi:hypothetical protein